MAVFLEASQYNELKSLEEASGALQIPSIIDVISGPIRDVFLTYGLHKTHGLYLQHAHHTLKEDEAVVKVEGTAHVMNAEKRKDLASCNHTLVPATWMTTNDGRLESMEYAAIRKSVTGSVPIDTIPVEFASKLLSTLGQFSLVGIFGVETLGEKTWRETSIGTASVVLPCDEDDCSDGDDYIPVALSFDEHEGFRVHGKCKTDHKHTSKPVKD